MPFGVSVVAVVPNKVETPICLAWNMDLSTGWGLRPAAAMPEAPRFDGRATADPIRSVGISVSVNATARPTPLRELPFYRYLR